MMKKNVIKLNRLLESFGKDEEISEATSFSGHKGKWVTMSGRKIFMTDSGKALGGDGKPFNDKKSGRDKKAPAIKFNQGDKVISKTGEAGFIFAIHGDKIDVALGDEESDNIQTYNSSDLNLI
jgi:hypothetical protein